MGGEERQAIVGYVVAVITILAAVALWMRWSNQEVEFCHRVLGDLVHGRQAAQRSIDWEHLKAMGVDVGAAYALLPDDKARAKYRETFIKGFAEGFRRINGQMSAFAHWRIYKRETDSTIVATDDTRHKKTLLFTIPATGAKQIEGIQWERAG